MPVVCDRGGSEKGQLALPLPPAQDSAEFCAPRALHPNEILRLPEWGPSGGQHRRVPACSAQRPSSVVLGAGNSALGGGMLVHYAGKPAGADASPGKVSPGGPGPTGRANLSVAILAHAMLVQDLRTPPGNFLAMPFGMARLKQHR